MKYIFGEIIAFCALIGFAVLIIAGMLRRQ